MSVQETDLSSVDPLSHKATAPLPSRSDVSLTSTVDRDNANASRKNKQKPFALLGRNRSFKEQDDNNAKGLPASKDSESDQSNSQPLKTAPVYLEGPERSFKHMMNSAPRNHSADRALPREVPGNKDNRGDKDQNRSHPSSYRDNSGSNFFTGLKTSGTWAFDMGKQFFAKGGRSGSSSHYNQANSRGDNGIDDEHYVLKMINLPLVEQTRMTRISKRLEDSRDKTEFWMPAFPWRAIDYLNYKGTEVEGLYRVPGSGPQIKKWQRKFDEGMASTPSLQTWTNTNSQKRAMSTYLPRMTSTISILLDPCSRHGYANFPTNFSRNRLKKELLANARALRRFRNSLSRSSPTCRHSITTSFSLSHVT